MTPQQFKENLTITEDGYSCNVYGVPILQLIDNVVYIGVSYEIPRTDHKRSRTEKLVYLPENFRLCRFVFRNLKGRKYLAFEFNETKSLFYIVPLDLDKDDGEENKLFFPTGTNGYDTIAIKNLGPLFKLATIS